MIYFSWQEGEAMNPEESAEIVVFMLQKKLYFYFCYCLIIN